MLVLTRKTNDLVNLSIECAGGFTPIGTVKVNKIDGNRVRLGFELRKDVRAVRGELECEQGSDGKCDSH